MSKSIEQIIKHMTLLNYKNKYVLGYYITPHNYNEYIQYIQEIREIIDELKEHKYLIDFIESYI